MAFCNLCMTLDMHTQTTWMKNLRNNLYTLPDWSSGLWWVAFGHGCGHNPPRRRHPLDSQPFTTGARSYPSHQLTITHSRAAPPRHTEHLRQMTPALPNYSSTLSTPIDLATQKREQTLWSNQLKVITKWCKAAHSYEYWYETRSVKTVYWHTAVNREENK